MTRYVISDTHLDHANIIEYCDRPFDDVEEMNETIVENWNEVVSPDDTVIFLGDLAMWGPDALVEWRNRLNGSILFIEGNHDDIDPSTVQFPVIESCTLSHDGRAFYCEHYPTDVPDDASFWSLYGHHHNNDVDEYPFIDPERKRVNLSVELIDYKPLSMDTLCELLDRGERYETLADAL